MQFGDFFTSYPCMRYFMGIGSLILTVYSNSMTHIILRHAHNTYVRNVLIPCMYVYINDVFLQVGEFCAPV